MTGPPPETRPYRRTAVFSERDVPAALTGAHSTKAGVWGVIHVVEGRLRYVVPSRGLDTVLDSETPGLVEPEVPHRVAPQGPVRFFVEFWR